jgi:hypothetical protein
MGNGLSIGIPTGAISTFSDFPNGCLLIGQRNENTVEKEKAARTSKNQSCAQGQIDPQNGFKGSIQINAKTEAGR